jgi:hypothetical protein
MHLFRYLPVLFTAIMLASAVAKTVARSGRVFNRAIPALATRSFAGNGYNYQEQKTGASAVVSAAVVAAAVAAGVASQSSETSCESKCAKCADKFAHTAMYPPIQPYEKGMLKVSDIHTIAYSVYGNPKGKPVLVVHGGPGGGTTPGKSKRVSSICPFLLI